MSVDHHVITVRMSKEEHDAICDAAWAARKSMNQFCLDLIMERVQKKEDTKEK